MDEKINVLKLQGDYFTKEKIRLLDEKLNEYLKNNLKEFFLIASKKIIAEII